MLKNKEAMFVRDVRAKDKNYVTHGFYLINAKKSVILRLAHFYTRLLRSAPFILLS